MKRQSFNSNTINNTAFDRVEMPVENMWQRIKIRSDKPEVMAILRELAIWREELARRKDIPRNRIMKDEALADIANGADVATALDAAVDEIDADIEANNGYGFGN